MIQEQRENTEKRQHELKGIAGRKIRIHRGNSLERSHRDSDG